MKSILLAITCLLTSILNAKEIKIEEFDSAQQTTSDLQKTLQDEITKGATHIKFPNGQWKWHSLSQLDLPSKAEPSQKKFPKITPQLEQEIKQWITTQNIKAVIIRVSPNQPANTFFRIEKCLTSLTIPYLFIQNNKNTHDTPAQLFETDGKATTIAPPHP